MAYTYDNGGNILTVKEYDYTTDASLSGKTVTANHTYSYTDSNWKDKLTSYNGSTIAYDAIGNPTTYYDGTTFVWQNGRELAGLTTQNGTGVVYAYDANGIRTRKTVGGVTTYYYTEDGNVVRQTNGTDTLWFYYDEGGSPVSFELNGTSYYYVKNLQGDIIAIVNASGTKLVEYQYDAWGKVTVASGSNANLAAKNPFRYRGYYYDAETGFYYLQSRYYDPQTGRFLNADAYADTGDTVLSTNMFAYCENDPVNGVDYDGKKRIRIDTIAQLKCAVNFAGCAYLNSKGYSLSAMFFNHYIYGNGKSLSQSNINKVLNAIKKSQLFKSAVLNKIPKKKEADEIIKQRIFFHFDSPKYGDLHYSVGKSYAFIRGNKRNGKWHLTIDIEDVYDFNETDHLKKVVLANYFLSPKIRSKIAKKGDYIYSIGTVMQFTGLGQVFSWKGTIYYDV